MMLPGSLLPVGLVQMGRYMPITWAISGAGVMQRINRAPLPQRA